MWRSHLGAPCSFQLKKSGERSYMQIVENKRKGARGSSPVFGRADELAASGALASLLASGAKLTDQVLLINAVEKDAESALSVAAKRIGGPLLFGKIWERLGIDAVLADLLEERAFEFPVERAVFVAALHRLSVSGSDCDCTSWMTDYDIPGAEGLDLHHASQAEIRNASARHTDQFAPIAVGHPGANEPSNNSAN